MPMPCAAATSFRGCEWLTAVAAGVPQILRRINEEIEVRRAQGEALPPPPKTAIAGPEYFGMNQPEFIEAAEALDPDKYCSAYW